MSLATVAIILLLSAALVVPSLAYADSDHGKKNSKDNNDDKSHEKGRKDKDNHDKDNKHCEHQDDDKYKHHCDG